MSDPMGPAEPGPDSHDYWREPGYWHARRRVAAIEARRETDPRPPPDVPPHPEKGSPMLTLTDVLDTQALAVMIAEGRINARSHPTEPLTILNYSEKAQFTGAWTHEEKVCRGLIVRDDTGEIVARPFPKFFNYGDLRAPKFDLDEPVVVTNKMDGSLGILYPLASGGWAVATRGSFTSDQALWATRKFNETYADRWQPEPAWTYLFEIVFPENRIVLDYGDTRDLFSLCRVNVMTGEVDPTPHHVLPITQVMPHTSLRDALVAPDRKNAEGFVIQARDFALAPRMMKIKQADYVALHAILTNTSARRVWEFLAVDACKHLIVKDHHWGTYLHMDPARANRVLATGDDWFDTLTAGVPDEFYAWLTQKITTIRAAAASLDAYLRDTVKTLHDRGVTGGAEFYTATRTDPHQKGLLILAKGGDPTLYVWDTVQPAHEMPFATISEDVA